MLAPPCALHFGARGIAPRNGTKIPIEGGHSFRVRGSISSQPDRSGGADVRTRRRLDLGAVLCAPEFFGRRSRHLHCPPVWLCLSAQTFNGGSLVLSSRPGLVSKLDSSRRISFFVSVAGLKWGCRPGPCCQVRGRENKDIFARGDNTNMAQVS